MLRYLHGGLYALLLIDCDDGADTGDGGSGDDAAVSGGENNTATGRFSAISGGSLTSSPATDENLP